MAFDMCRELTLAGTMPDGVRNETSVRVAVVSAFVVMKSLLLDERRKAKDAYDLFFVLFSMLKRELQPEKRVGLAIPGRPHLHRPQSAAHQPFLLISWFCMIMWSISVLAKVSRASAGVKTTG